MTEQLTLFQPETAEQPRRIAALRPYEGADRFSRELASWQPMLASASLDTLDDWENLTARTRDIIRNFGPAAGAVQSHLDNIIGSGLHLQAKPDWRALMMSSEWASEWAREVESQFRAWAYGVNSWIDASRQLRFPQMLGQAYRSYLTTGDIVATAEWIPERRRRGGSATAIKLVEPDRLSNPFDRLDSDRLRGGIEYDRHGAPLAYHIRRSHPLDLHFGARNFDWRRVPRETHWGRRQVIHIFDQERPDQPRGVTQFASVLSKFKMLEKYERVTLQAAILNAMYAATIESPVRTEELAEVMGGMDSSFENYLAQALDFHTGANVRFDGTKIPHLFPGEKLNFQSLQHPSLNFAEFEKAVLRHLAAGLGESYELLSRDYSETNYAGARAGLQEAWKFFMNRRQLVGGSFATEIYALWLEEKMSRGDIETPAKAPNFWAAKDAWCGCRWIGPGKGAIDPLKEEKADVVALQAGGKSWEDYCHERGKDPDEQLDALVHWQERFKAKGVLPPWVKVDTRDSDRAGDEQ